MAPKSGSTSKRKKEDSDSDDGSLDYQQRRDRNNVAVRKSREKSRARAKLTAERVATLRRENDELEGKLGSLGKELGLLKELLIARAGKKTLASAVGTTSSSGCGRMVETSGDVQGYTGSSSTAAADPNLVRQDHGYIQIDRKLKPSS